MSPDDTKTPLWSPDSKVRTTTGTIILVISTVAAGVTAWNILRSDVAFQAQTLQQHEGRLSELEKRLSADHDILLEIRGDVKALREKR